MTGWWWLVVVLAVAGAPRTDRPDQAWALSMKLTASSTVLRFLTSSSGMVTPNFSSAATTTSTAARARVALPPEFGEAEVRAFEVDVMRRIADLALIPPKLNTSPLPKYDYDQLDYGESIFVSG